MASVVKNKANDEYCQEFKKILDNQDLIEDIDLFGDYSTREIHSDLSSILKNDKYLKEKSLLKTVRNVKLKVQIQTSTFFKFFYN